MRRSRVRISVGPFYLWLLFFKGYLLDYNRKYLIRDGDLKNTGIVSNEDGTRRSSRSSTVIQVWIQVKYLVSRIYFSQRAVEVSNMPKQKWNRQNQRVIRLLVSLFCLTGSGPEGLLFVTKLPPSMLRVVQTQIVLFLKSMSERVGPDIEGL